MNQPPNPARITRTEATQKRGRIHMHLFTDATTAPALVTSPATLAGIVPPFVVWWTDEKISKRGRVARVIVKIEGVSQP